MPHYALVSTDGVPLRDMRLSGYDWQPGSTIYTGPEQATLRVVDVPPSNDPEKFAILVAKPLKSSRSLRR
jgi:hypothetical protein